MTMTRPRHGDPGPLLSIGYGDRPWPDFLARLHAHRVRYVIDVRSRPVSRFADFNRRALERRLEPGPTRCVYLGEQLGGRPDDPDCYVGEHLDEERCRRTRPFREGLQRLIAAHHGGHRAALMCAELDPERCHRATLIGRALAEEGILLWHIDRDGSARTQPQVIERLTGGQSGLFDESLRAKDR